MPVCFDIGDRPALSSCFFLFVVVVISCEMVTMEEGSKSEPKAQTKPLFEPKLATETVPQPSQKPAQHGASRQLSETILLM